MDWKAVAIEDLERYGMNKVAASILPGEIKELEKDACGIRGAKADGTSAKGGGTGREDWLLGNIVKRQILVEQLENVRKAIHRTETALHALSEEDRLILDRFYVTRQAGAAEKLCEEICVEKAQVYRRKDKALNRFAMARYGAS